MANHKSSLKRIRQDKAKSLHNKYYAKTMRNAVRKLRSITDKDTRPDFSVRTSTMSEDSPYLMLRSTTAAVFTNIT